MIHFGDIFKNSFLSNYSSDQLLTSTICVVLFITALFGLYIYFIYRVKTRNKFFSAEMGTAIIAITVITSGLVLTIKSDVVVSLGMVGALSIVRFRTAIKSPMDLVFLFWSISVGIICGAGLIEVGFIVSIMITLILFCIDFVPRRRRTYVLSVTYTDKENVDAEVYSCIERESKRFTVKNRSTSGGRISIVVEVGVVNDIQLSKAISHVSGVENSSLMAYDGDAVF